MPTTFSIIIPTFNRPRQLRACLQALTQLNYDTDQFEILVIDDGSSQPLDDIVREFELPLRLIRQENAGPAAARNKGVQEAQGRYLAFTDDDCAPDCHWLHALEKRLQHHPHALIGGHTLNALRNNPYASASQLLIDYLHAQWNDHGNNARFFASNNIALSAHDFRQIGGFDSKFTRAASEDREFCERWILSGRVLVYAPEAAIRHLHSLSLHSLWRQHFTYGRGAWQFYRARAARGGEFIKPRISFYLNLLRFPCTRARQYQTNVQPVPLMVLLLLTQIAGLAGFLDAKRHSQ